MYWLALGATALAAWFDAKRMEIPDVIPLCLAGAALVLASLGLHPLSWTSMLLGCGVAFAGSAVLFWRGALGGGDVKLLAALGLVLGIEALVPFLIVTALVGGILALVALRRGSREIAYAPAMLVGLLVPIPFVLLA